MRRRTNRTGEMYKSNYNSISDVYDTIATNDVKPIFIDSIAGSDQGNKAGDASSQVDGFGYPVNQRPDGIGCQMFFDGSVKKHLDAGLEFGVPGP